MNEKSFKWDAKLYQESSSYQFNLGLMAIKRLKPKDFENILEIGCGNAMLTIELAKKIPNGKITAIEISEEMFEQAKLNLFENGIKNINIINTDALNISFENEFDAVFSNSAIHWIRNLMLMYGLIYKSLKQKGRIMIQTGLKEINILVKVISKIVKIEEFRAYYEEFQYPWRFYTIEENKKILKDNHYTDILIDPYYYSVNFNTIDEVINYFKAAAMVPFLSVLPDDLKANFVKTFKKIFLELNDETNKLEIKMNRLFISAKK